MEVAHVFLKVIYSSGSPAPFRMGYIALLVLFFSPYVGIMGWILAAFFTPITIVITYMWFRNRDPLPLQYHAGVGVAWMVIAIVLDYLSIVLLFKATYYGVNVFVYYAATLLILVGIGLFLNRMSVNPSGLYKK